MSAVQLQASNVINFGVMGMIIGVGSGHDTVSMRPVPPGFGRLHACFILTDYPVVLLPR
jgi:hypothetical protein